MRAGTRFAMVSGMHRLGVLVMSVWLAGCAGEYATGQGLGDDEGGGTGAADFGLTISPISAELVLGETKTFTVEVSSKSGFTGTVTLTPPDVPPSWDVSFDRTALDVPANGRATATLTVHIPTDAEAAAVMLHVAASGAPGTRQTDDADLLVKPELVIRIPTDAKNNPDVAFGGEQRVRFVSPGTKITWVNDDDENHQIHAGNDAQGFPHEPNEMQPGASYTVTITEAGEFDYGCHLHGQMQGRLVVMQP